MPDKLIIFDYSGTLSFEMAFFARPDNLLQHLKSSGLFTLGVDSIALFWEIINATWTEGSTTRLGYKKVMQERICELFPEIAESRQPELRSAVSNFVDAYLDHSQIDEHWRSILQKLSANKSVQVIIATDHYAEATDVIINYLSAWNIQATTINAGGRSNLVVANSADIGVHKAEKKFWEASQTNYGIHVNQILLIDDFGGNEHTDDNYSDADKINARRKGTIEMLHNVFNAEVEFFYFIASDKRQDELIAEASAAIDGFLSAGKVSRSMID